MAGEGEGSPFLPPEASGHEPDLSEDQTRELGSSGSEQQSPADGAYAPPSHAQPGPGPGAPPPPPPSAAQGQWQGGWQGQPQPQQPWTYAPRPPEPDNGSAVAGFTLALVGGGLLLITFGLSSIVSVVCAGLGVFYSKRGRERVDRGETPKHRGIAQAGFIIGLISLVLSVLATLGYAAIVILYLTNDQFREDLDREFETQNAAIGATVIALRLARAGLSLIT